ncbi:hypothetical protein [Noviherbaspirillum pedocola]|uniref:Uncharacterized protein n=1 Tax=Noviherbaspirillum pedocola TaxID=2801341 RepID=A0A934SN70_9BURK|nr:hypothetical protein [Noviherbaspirillum pedocola]MBK4733636.1 hypothetical protein [Noviherbaspirillum pedocola]
MSTPCKAFYKTKLLFWSALESNDDNNSSRETLIALTRNADRTEIFDIIPVVLSSCDYYCDDESDREDEFPLDEKKSAKEKLAIQLIPACFDLCNILEPALSARMLMASLEMLLVGGQGDYGYHPDLSDVPYSRSRFS